MGGNLQTSTRPQILDRARIPLNLAAFEPAGTETVAARLSAAGGGVLHPSRWFDWWRIIVTWFEFWDRLAFNMQHQQQTNWCWAATSTSVAHYYQPASTWTQCAVANAQTGRNDCCGGGASGPCNVYGFLDQALQTVGHFDHIAGVSTFQQVDTEIDAGRPLGIRVAWSGGGAHFLAIIGYLEQTPDYVAVDDPIYGKSDLTYATLTTGAYQGSGNWTHSYFTKA